MYLKKLEILGFKSFANKTVIDFSKGMTAIVGPNGCGKTNILDALRWVLGEQKVSMLRGSKMEEIIFNGTRDAKPLGMSEVTLTLINNRGVLPTEYHEVQITRRLFRSGDSEYLINKVPCRLKDIIELFFDTGMGAHSYSVIQQDMIEAVISDKAEERRFLFEEAAGITKYKQRKKAALRKLEATENDFLRLNDIYSEVQTQVRSLKRQHNKAQRYQTIAADLKKWDIYLSSERLKESETKKRELKATHDSLHDQETHKDTLLDKLSSELESSRKDQIDLEQELSRVGNEIFEITEKAHKFETDINVLQEKKSNATSLIDRNKTEIDGLKIRHDMFIEQIDEIKTGLKQENIDQIQLEEQLESSRKEQAQADLNLLSARSSKEDHNQKMIELETRISSGKTEEDNLNTQKAEIKQLVEQLTNELTEVTSDKEQLLVKHEEIKNKKEGLASQKYQKDSDYKNKTEELEQLTETGEELSEEIAELNISIEASQARKNLLEEMILHYDGYESGVKSAMEVKEQWDGIYGTVAEKFVPVEGMEVAVEVALGEMAKFLICDNRSTAESIINYLKSNSKGRIGIMVPDSGTFNPVVKRPEINDEQFVGWLDQFVSTDEKLKPLMQAVLSRTAIFKGGSSPDNILSHLPYGFKAVSTDGELFSKNIIAGGSDDSLPLFRRQEKVDQLINEIVELKKKLEITKESKNRTVANQAELRSDLKTLDEELESLTEELNLVSQQFNEHDYQLNGFDTNLNRLTKEKKNQTDKLEAIKNRQYSLELNFGQLTTEKDSLISSIAVSSDALTELETKASNSATAVSEYQIKLVESRSRIQQTESKIGHLGELQKELLRTSEVKSEEIKVAEAEINHAKESILSFEEGLKMIFNSRREVTEKQNSLRVNQNEIMQVVTAKEKQVKEFRSTRDEINQQLHQIEMQLNNIENEINSIKEKVTEEYELNITALEIEYPDENVSREEAPKLLHDLKEQLKKFGAVNLLALEEYDVAFEREQFLKEQLSDLDEAKTDLSTTIGKINQTAKELFEDTIAKVRVNFKKLFTELFTGGEADIYLKDPSDPLESDIEIFARPRGKKLVSITMMSGGERALTAISLLFSLYMVKPSPFCILDEIDAPLDDANCRRFLKIIDNFSSQTQFIMITHNKITMEASNNIYGITMEQLGISKVVAVKFNEVEEDGQMVTRQNISSESDQIDEPQTELNEFELSEEEPANGEGNGKGNGHDEKTESYTAPESPDDLPQKVIERLGESIIRNTNEDDEDFQDNE